MTLVLAAAAAGPVYAANPAFPGAEGPGAVATGGRGGDVYHVTNLEADKAGTIVGSLQYGINNAPAAGRTIVFDVGGTIYLNGQSAADTLRYGKSNITIAGQTAPGPGITIAGTGTKWTGSNVILRNIAVRPNVNSKGITFDAFSMQMKNSIVDHVSATWYTDEGISSTDAGAEVTVQYANISEGLNSAGHAYGSIIATEVNGSHVAYHHNLYAHNASRLPRIGSETSAARPVPDGATLEFSNNVIYNWSNSNAGYSGTDQPSKSNFINNYFIRGYNAGSNIFSGGDTATPAYTTDIFQSGNVYDSDRDTLRDGVGVGSSAFKGAWKAIGKLAVNGITTTDSAATALDGVQNYVGMNWQNRSAIDARIINSVKTQTGQVITDLSGATQAAEWAALIGQAVVTRGANFDTDRDGMPDAWEVAHGTNPAVANHNSDFDTDGYTDLEEYLNDLAAWPASNTLTFTNANANGRYAQINNWGNVVQPSRFDTAQINSGTVSVDSVGQHAKNLVLAPTAGNSATLKVTQGWIDVEETLAIGSAGQGTVTQTGGLVIAGGSVVLGNGTKSGVYQLSGGTLSTPLLTTGGVQPAQFVFSGGTLHADVVTFRLEINGGTLAPGGDAAEQLIALGTTPDYAALDLAGLVGTTHMQANLLIAAGTLQIQLADATTFDKIIVDGLLTLGGTLDVQTLLGYSPLVGDRWLIGTAAGVSGDFTAITPGFATEKAGGNLYLVAVPEPTSLTAVGLFGVALLRRRRRFL